MPSKKTFSWSRKKDKSQNKTLHKKKAKKSNFWKDRPLSKAPRISPLTLTLKQSNSQSSWWALRLTPSRNGWLNYATRRHRSTSYASHINSSSQTARKDCAHTSDLSSLDQLRTKDRQMLQKLVLAIDQGLRRNAGIHGHARNHPVVWLLRWNRCNHSGMKTMSSWMLLTMQISSTPLQPLRNRTHQFSPMTMKRIVTMNFSMLKKTKTCWWNLLAYS